MRAISLCLFWLASMIGSAGPLYAADTCAKIQQESCGGLLQSCEKGESSRKAKYEDCKARVKDSKGPNQDDPNLKDRNRTTDNVTAPADPTPYRQTPLDMYMRARVDAEARKPNAVQAPPRPTVTPSSKATACEPAYKRWCNVQCNGDYGNYCFVGAVCDPSLHRCVKGTP